VEPVEFLAFGFVVHAERDGLAERAEDVPALVAFESASARACHLGGEHVAGDVGFAVPGLDGDGVFADIIAGAPEFVDARPEPLDPEEITSASRGDGRPAFEVTEDVDGLGLEGHGWWFKV